MNLHNRDDQPRIVAMLMILPRRFGRLSIPCPLSMKASYMDHGMQLQIFQGNPSLLHHGHFSIEKMKHLVHNTVYWPTIDSAIADLCRKCKAWVVHQNAPCPWWNLLFIHGYHWKSHGVIFHLHLSISFVTICWWWWMRTRSTHVFTQHIRYHWRWQSTFEDFASFGYLHTLVTDSAPTFTSDGCQEYCQTRRFVNLTGAPYHPATNGAAERLVQAKPSSRVYVSLTKHQ